MLSRPHSMVAEQAGTGEAAGILHPPAGGLPLALRGCLPVGQDSGVALWVMRSRCSAGCWHVSVRHTAPCQPRGWVRTATRALQPGNRLGKGLSRGNLGMESEFWGTWICTTFCTVYV